MKRIFMMLIAVCSLTLCFFAFGCGKSGCGCGCGKKKQETEVVQEVQDELVKLLNLRVEEENLCWNSVVNAKTYTLYVNDAEVKTFQSGDTLAYEYDKTENEYTAKLVVKGEKLTNFETSIQYSVKKLQVASPEVFANTVAFAEQTTKIYFRVLPATEWNEVNDSNVINFNSYQKGQTVEYEYYVEGTGYDAEIRTYYADSALQKQSLTVKEQLGSIELSIVDNAITWSAVAGAKNYTVVADGEQAVVDTTSFALSQAVGNHKVYVYANPLDEATYTTSNKAAVEYETAVQSVALFTVGDSTVRFDEGLLDVLYQKSGDTWTKAESATLDKSNLTVKLASHYDGAKDVYYLESKPLTFASGGRVEVTFDKTGYVNMANEGRVVEFKLYSEDESEPDDYMLTFAPSYYVGNCAEGKTYHFTSKFLDGIQQGDTEDIYYEYVEDTLEFYTLPTPNIKILNEKVVWDIDARAERYAYGTAEGQLNDSATESFVADIHVQDYYMQAIGSDEHFVLNSSIAKIDATKWAITAEQLAATYHFDAERVVKGVTTGSSDSEGLYDAEKQALKVVTYGQNKSITISTEFQLQAGDKLVVKALTGVSVGFSVNGVWKMNMEKMEGVAFQEYEWKCAEESLDVTSFSVALYVKDGAEMFIQSIQLVRRAEISQSTLETGFQFDSEAKVANYVTAADVTASYDTEKTALKLENEEKNKYVYVHFADVTLQKGESLAVSYFNTVKKSEMVINGTYTGVLVYDTAAADFQYAVYTATETITLSNLCFAIWGKTDESAVWIRSIKIVKPVMLTEAQLTATNGYAFDSEDKFLNEAKLPCTVSHNGGGTITYDATENAMKVVQKGSDATARELRFNMSLTLNAGDKIELVIKIANQNGGGSFRVNGAWRKDITSNDGYQTATWTVNQTFTDAYVGIVSYENDVAYYVKSIKIIRKSA